MRFCLLASGSKGNAVYISHNGAAVLVDCGMSGVELQRRLDRAGLPVHHIKAIILTHEHRDHSSGAGVMARRLRVPLLATPKTRAACSGLKKVRHQPFEAGDHFDIGGLEFRPFSIPHDAADPVGLVVEGAGVRLGLCTDLGRVTGLVRTRLSGCQALILESNHDPDLLASGPYPVWLKQRVRSAHGHLSNQEGSDLLAELHHAELRQVVLAHLSETNNTPELARSQASRILEGLNSSACLTIAAQDQPTAVIEM